MQDGQGRTQEPRRPVTRQRQLQLAVTGRSPARPRIDRRIAIGIQIHASSRSFFWRCTRENTFSSAPERQGAAWELENPASYEALFLPGGIVDTERASV